MRIDGATPVGWVHPQTAPNPGGIAAESGIAPSPRDGAADEVALSPGARILAGVLNGSSRLANAQGPIKVEDVRAEFERQMESLQDSLVQQFARRGIKDEPSIRLQTASDGRVIVAGDHPQKEAFDRAIVC
jgi:hypothetical protein